MAETGQPGVAGPSGLFAEERRPMSTGGRGAGGGWGVPSRAPFALAFFLPGVPQWTWRQRERAAILGGSFATSLAVGLLAWGTRTGLVLLAFAYLTHVVSAVDALRRWSFPDVGRWPPTLSASAGLAFGCYGPLILVGSLLAWPGMKAGDRREGYLINRLAYRDRSPDTGDKTWLGPDRPEAGGRLAEVIAGPGDEVEWTGSQLKVPGRTVDLAPFRPGESPRYLAFKVPDDRYLVAYRTGDPFLPKAWEMVHRSRFEGRAWAQLYPVWERKLLN